MCVLKEKKKLVFNANERVGQQLPVWRLLRRDLLV